MLYPVRPFFVVNHLVEILRFTQAEDPRRLWRDVPEPPGFSTEFWMSPHPGDARIDIGVRIRWPVRVFSFGDYRIQLPDKEMEFVAHHWIDRKILYAAKNKQAVFALVMSTSTVLAQSLAPRLYAYDVRIGVHNCSQKSMQTTPKML